MTTFISDDEVARLTGYKQRTKQIAKLVAEGIPFRTNARNEPIVTVAAVEGRTQEQTKQGWQPSWAGIRT